MTNQVNELTKGLTIYRDTVQIYCECKKHRIEPNSNIHEESTRTFKRDNLGFILIECSHRMLLLKIEQHLDIQKLKSENLYNLPTAIIDVIEKIFGFTKPLSLKDLLEN